MKKIYAFVGSLLISAAAFGATFQYFNPAAGILKGNPSTYVTTAAASSDILATFTGTCNNTTFMRGDGSCQTPPGAGGGTVNSVGLSAPSVFGVTGSPITNTGTLALSFATGQTANSFLATPDGTTGALSLRTIVLGDLPTITAAKGGTGVTTLTGIAKGNGTSAFTAAASSDVIATWSGTCSSSTFLRGDGSCQTPATGTGTVTSVALTVPSGFSVTGSPVTTSGTLAISGTLNPAAGGTGVATLTGIAKGNGTSAFSVAASGDVTGLWGGTCNSGTYLRGDGTCATPPTGGTSANPTALVGLTAVNGAAGTYLRSDGAPALDQSIAPTWTSAHAFSGTGARISLSGAGTASSQITYASTGGSLAVGLDGSGGGSIVTGGSAYAGTFATTNATGLTFGTNSIARQTISSAGAVTINAPTSGQALTVNGFAGTDVARFSGANQGINILSSAASAPMFFTPTSGDTWRMGAGSVNVSDFGIYNSTRTRSSIEISGGASGGNVSVQAAGSGDTLRVYGSSLVTPTLAAGTYGFASLGASGAARDILQAGQSGFSNGFTTQYNGTQMQYNFRDGNVIVSVPVSGDALTVTGATAFNVNSTTDIAKTFSGGAGIVFNGTTTSSAYKLISAGASRIEMGTAGNVTVNAPSSGQTLSLTGLAGAGATLQVNSGTGGASSGARFTGTGTSGNLLQIDNTGGSMFAGVDNSGGNYYLGGSSAYAGFLTTTNATALNLGTNGSTRQSISSAGNITVNAPSSGADLTLNGTAGAIQQMINMTGTTTASNYISASNTGGGYFLGVDNSAGNALLVSGSSAYGTVFGSTTSTGLSLATNLTGRLSINSTGNATLNAPTSGTALTVTAAASSDGVQITQASTNGLVITCGACSSTDNASIKLTDGSDAWSLGSDDSLNYAWFRNVNSGNDLITFDTSDRVAFPVVGTTATAANAVIDNGNGNRLLRSTSSRRYKKDIIPLGASLNDEVMKLKAVRYHSKAEADSKTDWFYGLIAEDVAEVEPRLVVYDKDGKPDGVQYERVGVLLLGVVQEQQEQIKALREELNELKKKVH